MNPFINSKIANSYDAYYNTDFGKKVDQIEKDIIKALMPGITPEPILELGCGTGHWTEFFLKEGFDVTALDISEAMLVLAKAKGLNANLILGDTEKLPFSDESFSVVASITMLEFVQNQDVVLSEIYRVLKPGGYLILGCINASSILGINKESDEVFKNAKLLTYSELTQKLQLFGKAKFGFGVYLTSDFRIVDNEQEANSVEPVFMAAIVQKRVL